ncbi:MAG: phenylalanine--tRNA ligase subunit beta [Tannerellaceae bacterium]|jgi:phenylalanyl-tRNA synthetase beta chain|nr:phenylalanine--tRNA ligase subunit beta [Tannerellaceae bacterium]
MNISYNWLKNYLDFDLSPEETAAALTSIGLETKGAEEVEAVKGGLEGLRVGEVLTCAPHPDSDHLHVTTVIAGVGEAPLQIVCGAPNVAAGQKVVVALPGTKLYKGSESFTIKRSKIRGAESHGMICAEDEIGIGTDHSGIIVLPPETPVGMLAKDFYNIKSDYVLEVDITPNRVDATSHWGVARDLAAYLKQNGRRFELKRPSVEAFRVDEAEGGINVRVTAPELCPRYSGATIRDVRVADSPEWLQTALQTIGLRPINNIVDVTNYVLHELGQPLHAFDADKIDGDGGSTVVVGRAREGEKFVTLDDVERILTSEDLIIGNEKDAMCIAGIFGGAESGVTGRTTNVFLESANFSPTCIRKTARRLGLSTDASFRFERGLDPNLTIYALKRAALLIQEVAGGRICGDINDIYPSPALPYHEVALTYNKMYSLIGKVIPTATVRSILESLEIEIAEETPEGLSLRVPLYRIDVRRDVDVIEEVLRIYGYNNVEIGESVKSNLSYLTPTDRSYKLQNLISEQLCGAGFNEIMNNSQTRSAYYENLETWALSNCVMLLNPISADLNCMRQTLLFGGLDSIGRNEKRKNESLRFFEFGNCYNYNSSKQAGDSRLAKYAEDFRLGLWICGHRVENNWAHPDEKTSIYEMKAYVAAILERMGIDMHKLSLANLTNDVYTAGLSIAAGPRMLGTLGIIKRSLLKMSDVASDVYYAELSWDVLMEMINKNKVVFNELSKFHPVKRDLALLLDNNIRFAEVEKAAYESERKMLKKVILFDVYEGRNLPAGKKSYAVSFHLQDEGKTLTDKQIDDIMKKIQTNLERKFGAQLR